ADAEQIRSALQAALKDLLAADLVRLLDVAQDRAGASDASDAFLRFAEGPSGTAHVMATGESLAIPDAAASSSIVPGRAAHHGIASVLFVPVRWADEVRSVLILGWAELRAISDDDIALAELAADSAAAGLARLEAEARRADGHAQDRVVVRVANALNATLDLQEILLTLVHEAALALRADFTGVFLGDGEQGAVATAGYGAPEGLHGLKIDPGQGATGRVLAAGATVVHHDYVSDLPLADTAKTLMAVPMVLNGEMRGVLTVGWATRRRINDEDQHTTEAIAGLATL